MESTAVGLFRSSIGKKYLMAITGLAWVGFVLMHMLSNLLIIFSPEAYNKYSHALVSNPFLPLAEGGLVVALLVHVFCGLKLAFENKAARPQGYAVQAEGDKKTPAASRFMAQTGTLILVFVITHIATFKYGTYYSTNVGGVEMRDIHRLVVECFHKPGFVAWYVVALVILGVHLSHGFASSFQSLGLNHPRYNCWIKLIGRAYAIVVALGFISQPLYVYLIAR